MIPIDYITEWRKEAPWATDAQVEQDLVISRAIVNIYTEPRVRSLFAFRGGTALYKLHLRPAIRYSEDIDLVQISPGPIGTAIDGLRNALDGWLGAPRRTANEGRIILVYRAISEGQPPVPIRLKIEINSREHFSVLGIEQREFAIRSRWFSGVADVLTYPLEELLGTKLRALYQRKKGRDLFDLHYASKNLSLDERLIVKCFIQYLEHEGKRVTRAEFEKNLFAKLKDVTFLSDVSSLISSDYSWNSEEAARYVQAEILPHLGGEPWRGIETVLS